MNKLYEIIDGVDLVTVTEAFRDYDDKINDIENQIWDLEDELKRYDSDLDKEEFEEVSNKIKELEQQKSDLKDEQDKEYQKFIKTLPKETNKRDFVGFNIDETDPSYWSSFIPGSKDREYVMDKEGITLAYITEITPEQYLELCSGYGWSKVYKYSIENIMSRLPAGDEEYIDQMAEAMKNGVKFKLPFIDIKHHGQEGRHRALAAMKAGIKTIPCLILA